MPATTLPPIATATAGAVCISSSAVLMRLADTSASITAFGRCAFALPVLGALVIYERRRGAPRLPARSRWLARLAGVFLAGDLIVWSHAIDAIGAGLGTVVTNLQVLIISLIAWLVLGERPRRSLVLASPVMLAGLALVGGLVGGRSRAYGTDPALGVWYGVAVAFLYAIYILMLRSAASAGAASPRTAGGPRTPAGGPRTAVASVLFEATLGAAATAAVLGLLLHDDRLGPAWPALGWLALLALTSQVIGWLLITVSMPRLPAGMIGTLLLVQPTGSLALSYVVLGERPSPTQLLGVALVLAGVVVAVGRGARSAEQAVAGPAEAGLAGTDLAEAESAEPGLAGTESRRSTMIIRHASGASTAESVSKSP
jgi:drug/metabolite transporter (DMT)-like permease